MSGMRRRSIISHPEQVFTTYTVEDHPHAVFLSTLRHFKADVIFKKFGVKYRILDESSLGSAIEFISGVMTNRQMVVTQKALVVENNGNIDAITFVAPHEEWKYLDHPDRFGENKVDVMQKSRYEVYCKLTRAANELFLQFSSLTSDGYSKPNAQQLLQNWFAIFPRYSRIFETKCRSCGKIMKDCLPCVYFDPRYPSEARHETCR